MKEIKQVDDGVEIQIKALLAEGELSALDLIWEYFSSELFGYLLTLLRSKEAAEDVLQEVFVTISKKRTTVAKAKSLRSYLFRLTRNHAFNEIRKRKRGRQRDQDYSEQWLTEYDDFEGGADFAWLKKSLEKLPEKQRVAVVFKFDQGMTFQEIGQAMGISENSASSCFRYGMIKLQKMKKYNDE